MASLAKFLEGGAFGVLNDILSEFHSDDGYAVPNRFECLILPPSPINANTPVGESGSLRAMYTAPRMSPAEARTISLKCESTTMPGRNLAAVDDLNIYGPSREIVNGVTYAGDVEMTFYASSGLKERVFFENWQKRAFDETNWNVGYHNEYTSEVQIFLLDKQDRRRYGIRLHEAWPKTIGAVALNQAPSSEIIKIPISFSFRWWENLNEELKSPNLKEKIFSTVINTVERNITRNIPRVLTRL